MKTRCITSTGHEMNEITPSTLNLEKTSREPTCRTGFFSYYTVFSVMSESDCVESASMLELQADLSHASFGQRIGKDHIDWMVAMMVRQFGHNCFSSILRVFLLLCCYGTQKFINRSREEVKYTQLFDWKYFCLSKFGNVCIILSIVLVTHLVGVYITTIHIFQHYWFNSNIAYSSYITLYITNVHRLWRVKVYIV